MEPQAFVYELPGMAGVEIVRDLEYAERDGRRLALDVYAPPGGGADAGLPAVIFVHGGGGQPPEGLDGYKEHAQYQMWGRLTAASGLIGVTFNHRSTPPAAAHADVTAAIATVRDRAAQLGIDRDRIAIWSCSAGGYLGLLAALQGGYARCAVCYYGVIDLELFVERASRELSSGEEELNPIRQLRDSIEIPTPLQIVRVGRDYPEINASLDSFVHAALEHNLNLELINYAAGEHAFDCFDDSVTSHRIIQRTLDFLAQYLE